MFCFDTSVAVELLRNNKKVFDMVDSLVGDEEIFLTIVTLCELYKGAYGHVNISDKVNLIEDFAYSFGVLDLDRESSKCFGEFWQGLRKKGKQVNDFDVLIASIVKTNNFTLVTRDKHFKKLGIKVVVV